jgi:hypothetical protein
MGQLVLLDALHARTAAYRFDAFSAADVAAARETALWQLVPRAAVRAPEEFTVAETRATASLMSTVPASATSPSTVTAGASLHAPRSRSAQSVRRRAIWPC